MSERGYGRFWTLFHRLTSGGVDEEDLKRDLVSQFSLGRTESLRELTDAEYLHLCEGLERLVSAREKEALLRAELRRHRSAALHQLQLYGVDTTDWGKVNAFCLDKRIEGKKFYDLSTDELSSLTKKMRAINKKKKSHCDSDKETLIDNV